ncbi:uncharacterized protein LY89DRAFT_595005 [Mollisia scopiformis]|uniref:Heterokaryon incompatibility domain-containing protein n=1 Tax=Mollisia scopiformis TaxID=149040 RepID=A0A194WTC0_MOLSC|nr:uncharacterized protein LY89DRAFT_595005 [Mollisia scopiformis]KUJ11206.1 hypothetical protein LY89DRAFT_595005 [Mollisia scopiformis]
MHLIYQEAAEVAVWLGDEDKESLLAWELIEDFERCQGDVNATRDLINISRERQFAGLLSLFRRDYFWRIWVVQEITCAQKARVHCGSKTISWSNLHRIGNDMERLRETLRDTIYRNKPAALFSLMTGGPKSLKVASDETFVEEKAPPLFDLLQLHMSKLSTDPHDKVYGLMGIASDGSSFGPIDYARSPRATFVHTACCIIRNTKKLNAICLRQDDDNIYNLPSWVPDWERRNLHPSHRVVGLHIRRPPFAAAKDTHADAKFKEDKEVLLTSGFVVDIITTAAKPLYLDGPESETTPTLIAFHNWFTVYTNNVREKDLDVFARTFCGGAWYPQYSEFEKDLSQRLVFFFAEYHGIPQVLEAREYAMVSSAALRMHAKRFIVTRTKLAGLAPQEAQEGDKIVVLLGCDFPVVMRDMGSYWKLIGEVYVDGIMYGEAMESFPSSIYEKCTFSIR